MIVLMSPYDLCCIDAGMAGDAARRRTAGSARLVLARQRARESRQNEARPQARQGDAREWAPVVRCDVHLAHRRQHAHEELRGASSCRFVRAVTPGSKFFLFSVLVFLMFRFCFVCL